MKKNRFLSVLVCLVFICLLLVACDPDSHGLHPANLSSEELSRIKNVIIIIGDGMGFNHIANAKIKFGKENVFPFEDNFMCKVKTQSLAGFTTDSAAAATALATGHKVSNGNVGRLRGKDFENIMTIAQLQGKKTGIVTSDNLYGATPAGFSSHANNRGDTEDIVFGQASSKIDIMVGKSDGVGYYTAQKELFESEGYRLIFDYDELLNVEKGQKVVANVNGLRSTYNSELSDQRYINDIVRFTLNSLDCENGFCLMIENAYVDKCSHDNDLNGALCEVRALSDTVGEVLSFCNNRNDTLVLVTADHETGLLKLAKSNDKLRDSLYSKSGHSSTNVPLYVFGCELVPRNKVDNTDIFKLCKMFITNSVD